MSNSGIAVDVRGVSMRFKLPTEKVNSIKEYVIRRTKRTLTYREFWALRDVSFTIRKGEGWALVGANGSGKSTLLKIIADIFTPTQGGVVTHGSIAPMINLGAGFDADLSARENIFLNGAVLGYKRRFLEEKFDEIVDFAELWDFLDVPVKNFSSGMQARLGFSIATIAKPDILIVDEILSVGDYAFRKKCDERIQQLLAGGTTLILVSHDSGQVKRLCQKAAMLEKGELKMLGNAGEVCDYYEQKGR